MGRGGGLGEGREIRRRKGDWKNGRDWGKGRGKDREKGGARMGRREGERLREGKGG